MQLLHPHSASRHYRRFSPFTSNKKKARKAKKKKTGKPLVEQSSREVVVAADAEKSSPLKSHPDKPAVSSSPSDSPRTTEPPHSSVRSSRALSTPSPRRPSSPVLDEAESESTCLWLIPLSRHDPDDDLRQHSEQPPSPSVKNRAVDGKRDNGFGESFDSEDEPTPISYDLAFCDISADFASLCCSHPARELAVHQIRASAKMAESLMIMVVMARWKRERETNPMKKTKTY